LDLLGKELRFFVSVPGNVIVAGNNGESNCAHDGDGAGKVEGRENLLLGIVGINAVLLLLEPRKTTSWVSPARVTICSIIESRFAKPFDVIGNGTDVGSGATDEIRI
jgi:hypothetical protein